MVCRSTIRIFQCLGDCNRHDVTKFGHLVMLCFGGRKCWTIKIQSALPYLDIWGVTKWEDHMHLLNTRFVTFTPSFCFNRLPFCKKRTYHVQHWLTFLCFRIYFISVKQTVLLRKIRTDIFKCFLFSHKMKELVSI